ncbi:hypothetical protein [Streptomyces lasiicapitis]|uniref:hypothetical protein n=1 Tax=Streptomyces lasiicapitis TaxID=1923961 RepID=UPI0036657FEF
MGIESDQLVFDYLSRVGDVAQQRQLSSGTRMRLVTGLRAEIDRRRAGAADSPAAVRRILDRLGTPDDLVDAAAANPDDISAAIPDQPDEPTSSRLRRVVPEPGRLRRAVPRPRLRPASPRRPASAQRPAPEKDSTAQSPTSAPVPRPRREPRPAPPHLASTEELGGDTGGSDLEPDWWRVDNTPSAGADTVHGFVGGVEIPEMLKPPTAGSGRRPVSMAKPGGGRTRDAVEDDDEDDGYDEGVEYDDEFEGEEGDEDDDGGGVEAARRRRLGGLLPPSAKAPAPAKRPAAKGGSDEGVAPATARGRGFSLSNPIVLLAALALLVGAIGGNELWYALAGGWIVAWYAPKLSRGEKKVGVFVMPGLAIAAGVGWLWGRSQGKWGEPIVKGHMNEAMAETGPWVLRGAAVASALFLVWRSQRQRPSAEE